MQTARAARNSDGYRAPADRPGAIAGKIRMDRRPAAGETDSDTGETIKLMCEYIRTSAGDPLVRACADYAWRRFGRGSADLHMKAWGAYWWVKHCLKFRLDEATMVRVGLPGQQDLLLSPSVLFRMKDPAEDCDGFSMALASLCSCLGVPVVIATVAADPSDPSRWSHVFPVAIINGKPLPLDASHGPGPGWMVPPERVYRWQCWGLDGKPVDIPRPRKNTLHGYVRTGGAGLGARRGGWRRRGVGDYDDEGNYIPDTSTDLPYLQDSTPLYSGLPGLTSSSGSSSSIFSFLSNLVSNAANVAKTAVTPTTTITYPGGATVTGPAGSVNPAGALGLSSSSLLPLLGVGILAFVLISAAGKKH
jgi:hypothetical protein